MKPEKTASQPGMQAIFALVFGVFLGLCLWKFGNPVILDHKIVPPKTWADFLNDTWPTHWANWFWVPLACWGGWLVMVIKDGVKPGRPGISSIWLWLLPLIWLAWQFVSATQTVDVDLTSATLWQYSGCVAVYFLGAKLFNRGRLMRWLLVGVLAVFAFCLVRAVNQRVSEFPQNYQVLVEGERTGWTNFPPATVAEMETEGVIVFTNGVPVANPAVLAKFAKGRVCGTLVYPNALAQIILLLWPVSLVLAVGATRRLRPAVRWLAIGLTVFLGSASFFWSGSKLGWLLGIALGGLVLLRLNWSRKLKFMAVAAVLVLGLGVFAVRFHQYFAAGATSAGARFDYWRAAVQTTEARPVFGTGPGTFQRPYAALKSPDSEMARLAHNDYLEQFSDSGVLGGLAYTAWIVLALVAGGRKLWRAGDPFKFAIYLGVLGWFAQGFGEFGLFVPALAWIAFTLLGWTVGRFDGPPAQK